jgi:hypothetical protein
MTLSLKQQFLNALRSRNIDCSLLRNTLDQLHDPLLLDRSFRYGSTQYLSPLDYLLNPLFSQKIIKQKYDAIRLLLEYGADPNKVYWQSILSSLQGYLTEASIP